MTQSRMPRRAVATALALTLTTLLTTSCLFEDLVLSVFTSSGEEITFISISTSLTTGLCEETAPFTYTCTFGGLVNSTFQVLSLPELLGLLFILDPMVVQFPAEAADIMGSFSHESGAFGPLQINSGLASVPVDDNRTLFAEPGTQLVTIELPADAPTSGDFAFNYNFTMPPGITEVVTKPLFTAHIELADGSVFQAPLLPCVFDMAQVPELVIPVPAPGGIVEIPKPNPALACDGEVYEYFGGAPTVPAALEVDPESLVSDGNGVFEPGETVEVAPAWRNNGDAAQSLTGAASEFTGPPGAAYTLAFDAADYGTLDPDETASCLETGVCYQMVVDDPTVRPALHWDGAFDETLSDDTARTWTLHIGDSFLDVSRASPFYHFVETLLHSGITSGCTGSDYCPAASNTRAQMAVFVLKAREGLDFQPPACTPGEETFDDVPATYGFCRWIEELARRQVVAGCGGNLYCPTNPVTRAQMAIFLLKTLEGPDYAPPTCDGLFGDVACPSPFADWIEELSDRGITSGCSTVPPLYCPAAPVTRQQMAVFVSRTFGLALYGL